MRILICGGAGFRNSGDEALLRACVQACLRASPGGQIGYLANSLEVAVETLRGLDVQFFPSPRSAFFLNDTHYGRSDCVFIERWQKFRDALVGKSATVARNAIINDPKLDFCDRPNALRSFEAIVACDALVVHGGGILTSPTRSRLWEQALTVMIADQLGKRVLLRSHQLGPLTNDDDRRRMTELLSASSYVSTRDLDQSRITGEAIIPSASIVDQIDDALMLETDQARELAFVKEHGLVPGSYICVGYRDNLSVGTDEACYKQTAQIVTMARELFEGGDVVLLPQGPFDVPSLRKLEGHLNFKCRLVAPRQLLDETIAIAANARVMIACPHHSLIFALRGGVPILSPIKGDYYYFKNVGSMRFFGLADFVVDLTKELWLSVTEDCLRRIRENENAFRKRLTAQVDHLRGVAKLQDQEFNRRLYPETY